MPSETLCDRCKSIHWYQALENAVKNPEQPAQRLQLATFGEIYTSAEYCSVCKIIHQKFLEDNGDSATHNKKYPETVVYVEALVAPSDVHPEPFAFWKFTCSPGPETTLYREQSRQFSTFLADGI